MKHINITVLLCAIVAGYPATCIILPQLHSFGIPHYISYSASFFAAHFNVGLQSLANFPGGLLNIQKLTIVLCLYPINRRLIYKATAMAAGLNQGGGGGGGGGMEPPYWTLPEARDNLQDD